MQSGFSCCCVGMWPSSSPSHHSFLPSLGSLPSPVLPQLAQDAGPRVLPWWNGMAGCLNLRGYTLRDVPDAVRPLSWSLVILPPLPFRISYCTADKMHDKVFAYIAQSQHNENLECHAFLCTKRKMVSGGRLGLGSWEPQLGGPGCRGGRTQRVSVKSLKSLGTSGGPSAGLWAATSPLSQ